MAIVVDTASRELRRRLGSLRWTVLEELALSASADSEGWAAPLGARGIAQLLGITKDTAAKALSALAAEGLITRGRLNVSDGRIRSGYRLNIPAGSLSPIPSKTDGKDHRPVERDGDADSSDSSDSRGRPTKPDGLSSEESMAIIGGFLGRCLMNEDSSGGDQTTIAGQTSDSVNDSTQSGRFGLGAQNSRPKRSRRHPGDAQGRLF